MIESQLHTRLEGALPKHSTSESKSRKKKEIIILEEALSLLAEKGYAKFSMRGVAATCGVSLRTVQYYFPTKKDLLLETVKYTLAHYYNEKIDLLFEKQKAKKPKDRLIIVIDYMMQDWKSPFTIRFFSELWALSVRDKDAAIAMDVLYTLHRHNFEELIKAANPALSKRKIAHRAVIASMLIEGLGLVLGHGKPRHKEFQGIEKEIKSRILDVVMMPDDAPLY